MAAPLTPAEARASLDRIGHLVVVMMENRSFDHMLGHLSLDGRQDVDGLTPDMGNSYKGRRYTIHPLAPQELESWEDPDHSGDGVARQLENANGGFVRSYIESRPAEHRAALEAAADILVTGYYEAASVPVYSHLAEHYCVCDRWFASVPGATWPNRLYALCGQSGGRKDNKKLFGKIDWPLHHYPSFVRELDRRSVSWRWYHAHPADLEPPTIQVADMRYFFQPGEHFALVSEREPVTNQPSFLEDATNGDLPSVTWVDPDLGITKRRIANDDHPPADIGRGQAFIRTVVNALMKGDWKRTLLLVVYDEHGGFFDHVSPPAAVDDDPDMRRYGVRVPAIVVSPFAEPRSVAHDIFDHTSIIRTVFERFCRNEHDTIPWLGSRVAASRHLGYLLTRAAPADPVPVPELAGLAAVDGRVRPDDAEHRRLLAPRPANLTTEPLLADPGPALPYLDPLEPVNDLQLGLLRAGWEKRDLGSDGASR